MIEGVLTIVNPNGDSVQVYDVTGRVLYSSEQADTQLELTLPTEQSYIVRIGSQLYKVR